jgi:hypothetical protein
LLSILDFYPCNLLLRSLSEMEHQKQSKERPADSLDYDRRHLLAPSIVPSVAPSVASSRPGSIVSFTSDCKATENPSGHSTSYYQTQPKRRTSTPYKGYSSEAAYLKALQEFGRENEYFESNDPLIGFYGTKTTADYLREHADAKAERDAAKARRKADKEETKRRKSIAKGALPPVTEDESGLERDDGAVQPVGTRRMSKGFLRVFTRRGTMA